MLLLPVLCFVYHTPISSMCAVPYALAPLRPSTMYLPHEYDSISLVLCGATAVTLARTSVASCELLTYLPLLFTSPPTAFLSWLIIL